VSLLLILQEGDYVTQLADQPLKKAVAVLSMIFIHSLLQLPLINARHQDGGCQQ